MVCDVFCAQRYSNLEKCPVMRSLLRPICGMFFFLDDDSNVVLMTGSPIETVKVAIVKDHCEKE